MYFSKNNKIEKKEFLKILSITFFSVFVTNAIIVYLWNLLFHGKGAFNWGVTIVLAITISIAVSLASTNKVKKKN